MKNLSTNTKVNVSEINMRNFLKLAMLRNGLRSKGSPSNDILVSYQDTKGQWDISRNAGLDAVLSSYNFVHPSPDIPNLSLKQDLYSKLYKVTIKVWMYI